MDDAISEVDRLARQLQAEGPDEFPFGYYQHLAAKQLEGDDDD